MLLAALKLLEAPSGPVLEDFPEDAPVVGDEPPILACPWVPPADEAPIGDDRQLVDDFRMELTSLRPWYDRALKLRGRTTVGLSRLAPEAFPDFFGAFLEGGLPESPRADVSLDFALRYVADDLKAWYYEAATAQPGAVALTSDQVDAWFWHETVAGKLLRAVRDVCLRSRDEAIKRTGAGTIVPVKHLEG